MATISDVQDALATLITAQLYPAGPSSVLGYPVKVYAGWPAPQQLDIDLAESPPKSGKPIAAHVSIYPLPAERNTTRYPSRREEIAALPLTYSLTAAGQTVTVGGAAPSPYVAQNFAIYVNGTPYPAQALAGQTAADLAASLLAALQVDYPGATLAGSVITLPGGARIGDLRGGSTGATIREVRRQEKQFQIAVWSSNPLSRAAVADTFDPVLADTPYLTLADASMARLIYHGSREDDFTQKQRIYRRSLMFSVEYQTTITEKAAQLLYTSIEVIAGNGQSLLELDFSDPANSGLLPLI